VRALHGSDWPTPGEFSRVSALVDAMVEQTRVLVELKESLIAVSRHPTVTPG
jgi:hypothetical protein